MRARPPFSLDVAGSHPHNHGENAWNRSPGAAEGLAGVTPVAQAAEAFAGDAAITMLADDAALRARGFAVRRCDTFPGLDDSWIRIAVRAPEVSTATRQPARTRSSAIERYQSSGTPGGSEPQRVTHCAEPACSRISPTSASRSGPVKVTPGALILVVVPSDSAMVMLDRTSPSTGTAS